MITMLTKPLLLAGLATLFSSVAIADDTADITGPQCDVNFMFDSSALPITAPGDLAHVASLSLDHPELRLVLDGNTDPIGTFAYNAGLSVRRADAVRVQLVALGVDNDKILIAAYGENAARRATYADDRRVTVWTTRQSIAAVIGHTFAGHGIAVKWNKPLTQEEVEMSSQPMAAR